MNEDKKGMKIPRTINEADLIEASDLYRIAHEDKGRVRALNIHENT